MIIHQGRPCSFLKFCRVAEKLFPENGERGVSEGFVSSPSKILGEKMLLKWDGKRGERRTGIRIGKKGRQRLRKGLLRSR